MLLVKIGWKIVVNGKKLDHRVSTVNIAEIQKKVDELSKTYREIDSKIQALNWQTEMGE